MTRTHAARQLLALGPLTFGQFATITGWPVAACRRVLSYLVDDLGQAERIARTYRLIDDTHMPDLPALATQGQPGHGPAAPGALRPGASLGVPAAAQDLRQAQAGETGSGRAAGGVGCEVSA